MKREEIDEQTREDWRDLGFFYEYDKDQFCWRLVGSWQGLGKFCDILNEYSSNERNATISEHEHYGPYWYLKLITWDRPMITQHDIRGRFEDFQGLSELIKGELDTTLPGNEFVIDNEYSDENEAKLLFAIKEDGFDPANADPLL